METTATLKHKKVSLAAEGCDPSVVKEPIYFRDDKRKEYVLVDSKFYESICDGSFKL